MTVYGPDMGGLAPGVQSTLRSGILDQLGNPTSCIGAYSFRLLRANYTGPVAIVYRGTTDTVGKYIYAMPNGTVDYQTIRRYGTSSDLLVTFFDQSTVNGNFVLGSQTPSLAPKVMVKGALQTYNGHIVANFDGTQCSGRVPFSSPTYTRVYVVQFNSTAAGQTVYSDGVDNAMYFPSNGSLAVFGTANLVFKTGLVAGDAGVAIEQRNGAATTGIWNGVSTSGVGPGNFNADSIAIAGSCTAAGVMTGAGALNMMEMYQFNVANLTAAQLSLLYTNPKAYYGLP